MELVGRTVRTVLGGSTRTVAVSDSAGDLLVPLILGLSVEEANNAHGHVVAANATGLGVGGQAVVHHVLANLVEFLLGSNASSNELNHGLGGLAIPDTYANELCYFLPFELTILTVAGKDKELVLVCEIMLLYIGVGSDNLVFRRQLSALLEFKITNSS